MYQFMKRRLDVQGISKKGTPFVCIDPVLIVDPLAQPFFVSDIMNHIMKSKS